MITNHGNINDYKHGKINDHKHGGNLCVKPRNKILSLKKEMQCVNPRKVFVHTSWYREIESPVFM